MTLPTEPSATPVLSPAGHVRIAVTELTQIGEARRAVLQLAAEAGFDETLRSNAAIVASELATNLARYGDQGEILLHATVYGAQRWIDVLSIDRGPGITDVPRSLTDGYSTGGTPGNGLGAVRRLSTDFDLYSATPGGTVVFARLASKSVPAGGAPFQWGAVCRAAPHEFVSGDAWRIAVQDRQLSILLVDGLGHGPDAAAASLEGIDAFDADPFASLPETMRHADARMRGSRGGAAALAQLDASTGRLQYVGVGNISGVLRGPHGEGGRGLMTHNGTLGVQVRKVQVFEYECAAGGLLIMHSDGLQSRWSLTNYSGLAQRHPAVIAGVLYRDFTRGRDDVTVAVVRRSVS